MPTVRHTSQEPDWLRQARAEGRILNEVLVNAVPKPIPAPTPSEPAGPHSRRETVATGAPPRLVLEVDVPVRTTSEANAGGKLRAKIARKTQVKAATAEALPALAPPMPLPVVVTLTRFGVRELDDDNLRRSLKAVRDVVAHWLDVDDADPRVAWRYRQRPAWKPFVRLRIASAP